MKTENLTFEEAFSLLEENVSRLRSGALSLEDSVAAYENCAQYHKMCTEILAGIRQKIEIYDPDNKETRNFSI